MHLKCCRRLPSVLEFCSYLFNFHGILIGPQCFFNDYITFVDGSQLTAVDDMDEVCLLLLIIYDNIQPLLFLIITDHYHVIRSYLFHFLSYIRITNQVCNILLLDSVIVAISKLRYLFRVCSCLMCKLSWTVHVMLTAPMTWVKSE